MGLRVNTNVASMNAQRNLANSTVNLGGNYSRLSSGLRIATAADDAAGLGISERMRSDIRSFTVASRNAQDGISMVQTAEGALNEVSDLLGRMRELSMQSANGTLSDDDRTTLDAEFSQLVDEIDRISTTTEFNGVKLLDGSNSNIAIQVGIGAATADTISVSGADASTSTLGISGGISTASTAQSMLGTIDSAIDDINSARGTLGAQQNRLGSTLRSLANVRENTSAAESRIRDVDVAMETADLTRNSILQQAATSILSQANQQPQLALSLLG
ncbi:Flagellin [Planctomycetes bacterium Poly30]|uniref:Flagellin n=1 Tax=Saltatorellus ferox TaxID=2528018 RepID=A0A518ELP5_9BACT|nr:Flagellin [Planctomycetes bacterium Poly30]